MNTKPVFQKGKPPHEQHRIFAYLKSMPRPTGASNCLKGLTIVITGTLPTLTRAEAKSLIEKYGGKLGTSVTSKTDVVVRGYDEETSKKLTDAQNKGIPITDQEGLYKFINDSLNPQKPQKPPAPKKIKPQPNATKNPVVEEYLNKMEDLQQKILTYLDDSQDIEENFQNISQFLEEQKFKEKKEDLTVLFHMLTTISNNHIHFEKFYDKIDKILNIFKEEIKKYFLNSEIFNIFKSNKRILLFLVEEDLMKFDEYIISKILKPKYMSRKYFQYFSPEIQPFMNEKWFPKIYDQPYFDTMKGNLPEDFIEKRKIGENDSYICELIRKDMIKEFIVHITKESIPLDSGFNISVFETNSFLLMKRNKIGISFGQAFKTYISNYKTSLIEYAAFFGAIQIFEYLRNNEVVCQPSLWIFAIHGSNPEIIHTLEENSIIPDDKSYQECLFESIKSHHNDIVNYIINNMINKQEGEEEEDYSYDIFFQSLKSYNFTSLANEYINANSFQDFCKYDYYSIVEILLKEYDIDINKAKVLN